MTFFVIRNADFRFVIFSLREKNSFAPRQSANKFGSALGLASFPNSLFVIRNYIRPSLFRALPDIGCKPQSLRV